MEGIQGPVLGLGQLLHHVVDQRCAIGAAAVLAHAFVGGGGDTGTWRRAEVHRHSVRSLVRYGRQHAFS